MNSDGEGKKKDEKEEAISIAKYNSSNNRTYTIITWDILWKSRECLFLLVSSTLYLQQN